jgi:hypothetical protein
LLKILEEMTQKGYGKRAYCILSGPGTEGVLSQAFFIGHFHLPVLPRELFRRARSFEERKPSMNKIYKVIWSKVKNCYVVVSEIARNHGKEHSSRKNIPGGGI